MQPRRRTVGFTARAEDDRDAIFEAGIEQWGEERAASYIARLYRALSEIAEYPEIGRAREDMRPGVRSLRVEEHVVYYRITRQEIRVTRILHRRQDLSAAAGI